MQPDQAAADGAQAAARYIEEEEGAAHRLPGALGHVITAFAVIMSVFHLYAAYAIVPANVLRAVHVGFVLALSFLSFPATARLRDRLAWWDWLLASVSVGVIAYVLAGGDALADRATVPTTVDICVGVVLIVLVLEVVRRASGWIMPAVVIAFIAYAMLGSYLPAPWTHRGYEVARLVGHMVMTLEGIFGPAVDVSSTLIILFTLFGAFLSHSGAGNSSSIFRWLHSAASAMERDAASCLPPSCWAAHPAAGLRRRSPSARLLIRCWPRRAMARMQQVDCSQPAAWAPF